MLLLRLNLGRSFPLLLSDPGFGKRMMDQTAVPERESYGLFF